MGIKIETDFMLRALEYIKVLEKGMLVIIFKDGTEIECKSI